MRAETRSQVIARRLASLAAEPVAAASVVDPANVGEAVGETGHPVPDVGRHAQRRRWLPVTLRGSVGLEPWHGVVVAGAVALVALGCCWWLLQRTPTVEVATGPAVVATAALTPVAGVPSSGASPGAGVSPGVVTVDVAGKVRRPGVRQLPAGSRVVDALRAAGGARRGVDLSGLNQARVLVDGEQVFVGPGAGAGAVAGGGSSPADAGGVPGGLVNLNTATLAQLDTLPGVGPVTAQAIVDYREQHGGFGGVAELLEVDGIGPATLAKLEPHVTV